MLGAPRAASAGEFERLNREKNPEMAASRPGELGAGAALGLRVALSPNNLNQRKAAINRLLFEDRWAAREPRERPLGEAPADRLLVYC